MARYCSIILCIAVAALVTLGLIMLASTSVWVKGVEDPYHFLSRQALMAGVGVVAAMVAAFVPVERLRKLAFPAFIGSCILLALCFVDGIGVESFGSKRWIRFPVIGQFQPSEPAKMVVIFCLAAWFTRWQTEVHTFWRGFIIPGVIAGVPLLLIAMETDIGSALSLSAAVAAVLFCVGTRLRYMIPSGLAMISMAAIYVYHNENRWSRIEAWLDLENPVHQLDKGMQQWRALLALGNGGPRGVGLGEGYEKFGTLSLAHIDFIFPVIGEELGLRATLAVVLCYVLIAVAGCGIAMQASCLFKRCLALGLTCLLVIPSIQNIGVTTALLPNDGLPLPFVSYGGTNLVFSLMAVGILIGIHRRSAVRVAQEFPLSRETRLAVRL